MNEKISKEKVEENRKRLDEAIGFAKLDNRGKISLETQELYKQMVAGEISPDDVVKSIIERAKRKDNKEN